MQHALQEKIKCSHALTRAAARRAGELGNCSSAARALAACGLEARERRRSSPSALKFAALTWCDSGAWEFRARGLGRCGGRYSTLA